MSPQPPVIDAVWLGKISFSNAYSLQTNLLEKRKSNHINDTLLLLEHDHTYTIGRRGLHTDIYLNPHQLTHMKIKKAETDRGGEVTYHGPGQLVAYPIVNIRNLGMGPITYVRMLEEAAIQTLATYGVQGHRVVGKTGIWVGGEPGAKPKDGHLPSGRKIAAIGVRVSGGVAMHGIAINVSTDLEYYSHIKPCGMDGLEVTSIENELHTSLSARSVAPKWTTKFAELLTCSINWKEPAYFKSLQSAHTTIGV